MEWIIGTILEINAQSKALTVPATTVSVKLETSTAEKEKVSQCFYTEVKPQRLQKLKVIY